jgi:hypothetical protein
VFEEKIEKPLELNLHANSIVSMNVSNTVITNAIEKSKLGDAHASPQEISKRYKRQSLGMPRGTPSSSAKIRSPFKTLYFYCFMHYAFFLERQLFLFSVFFCFVCCNKWLDHIMFLLEEMNSLFICQEHSSFHSYRSTSVLFFCYCV